MSTDCRHVVRGVSFTIHDPIFETESAEVHVTRAAKTFFGETMVLATGENVFVKDGFLLTLRVAPNTQRMEEFQNLLRSLERELAHFMEL